MAKIFDERKMVIEKIIIGTQNALSLGRQILYALLVTHETLN